MADLKTFYDSYWSLKDDSFDTVRLNLMVKRVPEGSRLLEIGCGPGILGKLLREKGVHVTGLDLSRVALTRACQKRIAGVECDPDGKPFPFRDGAFDCAASNSSLEHMFQPQEALKEIHRVLAPGGTFLWMVPNVGHWRFRLWLLWGRFPTVPNTATDFLHLRMYTLRDAADLLKESGFMIRSVTGSAGTWVPRLYPSLFRIPGIRHLYEWSADFWPAMLCRYLLLEAEKVGTD